MYRFVLILVSIMVVLETMTAIPSHRYSHYHKHAWRDHNMILDKRPIWKSDRPISSSVGFSANLDRPISNSVGPGANSEKPISNSVGPNTNSDKPISNSVGPNTGSDKPISNSVAPSVDSNNIPNNLLNPNGGKIDLDISNDIQSEEFVCSSSTSPPAADSLCCGVDATSTDRIIGGNVTQLELYPWLVQIEYEDKNRGGFKRHCGGFLISGRYVLSAAHCFSSSAVLQYTPVNVVLGEYDANHDGPDCVQAPGGTICTDGSIKVPISTYRVHAEYVTEMDDKVLKTLNDIAIVMLARTVEYTRFIRPICLPTSDIATSAPTNLRFTTAGWGATIVQYVPGTTNVISTSDHIKRHVDVPFVKTEECAERFNFITKNHICAGGEAGKDSCGGDSGGPLMNKIDGVYEAVGMVSMGEKFCGTEQVPSIYTNVYQYLGWIHEHINTFNVKFNLL